MDVLSKNATALYNQLLNLFEISKFPSCILLYGNKGCGKLSVVKNLIYSITGTQMQHSTDVLYIPNNSLIKETSKDGIKTNLNMEKVSDIIRFANLSASNGNKFIIIDTVDFISINIANSLLKLCEEPPVNTYIILLSNSPDSIIDTIKSRVIKFQLKPLSIDECKQKLEELGYNNIDDKIISLSGNSPYTSIDIYESMKITKNSTVNNHFYYYQLNLYKQLIANMPDKTIFNKIQQMYQDFNIQFKYNTNIDLILHNGL